MSDIIIIISSSSIIINSLQMLLSESVRILRA